MILFTPEAIPNVIVSAPGLAFAALIASRKVQFVELQIASSRLSVSELTVNVAGLGVGVADAFEERLAEAGVDRLISVVRFMGGQSPSDPEAKSLR